MNRTARRNTAVRVYWTFMAVAWTMLAFLAGIIYALLTALQTPVEGITHDDTSQPVQHALEVQADVPTDRWKIDQAIRAWNQAGADVTLVDSCQRGSGCVHIVQAHEPTATWAGRHYTYRALIALNTAKHQTPTEAQMIACHELGHALGAHHQEGTCMEPVVSTNTTPPPLP